MVESSTLIDMFEALMALEEDKKAIAAEIKDSLETYAKNTEKNKKSVKDLFAKYKAYKADPEEFVLVDFEVDQLLDQIIPGYAEGR